MELAIDETGNVIFENGDLVLLEDENAEFEQRLSLWLQAYHDEVIGDTLSRENTIEELKLQTQRVANRFDLVNEVISFNVQEEGIDSFDLYIEYEANGSNLAEINIGEQ